MNLNGKIMATFRDELLYNPNRSEAELISMLNSIHKSSENIKSLWVSTVLLTREGAFKDWAGSLKLMEAFVAVDPSAIVAFLTKRGMQLPTDMLVQVLKMKHTVSAKSRLQAIETASYLPDGDPNRKTLKDYAVDNIPASQVGVIRTTLSKYGHMLTEDEIVELAEKFAKKRSMIPVPWASRDVASASSWSLNMERVLKRLVDLEKEYHNPEAKPGAEDLESELFSLLPSERLAVLTATDARQMYELVKSWAKEGKRWGGVGWATLPHVPELSFSPKLGELVQLLDNIRERETFCQMCPSTTGMRAIVEHICKSKDASMRVTPVDPPIEEGDTQLREDLAFLYENLTAEQFFRLVGGSSMCGAGSTIGEIARPLVLSFFSDVMAAQGDDAAAWELGATLSSMTQAATLKEIKETASAAS